MSLSSTTAIKYDTAIIDWETGYILYLAFEEAFNANFPKFYNSSKTADSFSASCFCFMHDFLEMQGSQL